jgi:hypothetical protein
MSTVLPESFQAPLSSAMLDRLLRQETDPAGNDDEASRECVAEAALRRHLQRIHESHYASESPQPRELFHVG